MVKPFELSQESLAEPDPPFDNAFNLARSRRVLISCPGLNLERLLNNQVYKYLVSGHQTKN